LAGKAAYRTEEQKPMPLALWPFPTAMLADGVAVVVGGKAFRAGRCGWSEGSGACGLWVGSAWKT